MPKGLKPSERARVADCAEPCEAPGRSKTAPGGMWARSEAEAPVPPIQKKSLNFAFLTLSFWNKDSTERSSSRMRWCV